MIQNPILPGFCPDPSIIRVGEDYYIANSSFEWWPGVKIYHSKDLKHYEQLPSPLNRMSQLNMVGEGDSCGVWAPDISWDGEYFWLIYTDVKTRTGGRDLCAIRRRDGGIAGSEGTSEQRIRWTADRDRILQWS